MLWQLVKERPKTGFLENGTPVARPGHQATGLSEIARPPNSTAAFTHVWRRLGLLCSPEQSLVLPFWHVYSLGEEVLS
jgi:hypothetical protein